MAQECSISILEFDSVLKPDIVWVRDPGQGQGRPVAGDLSLVIELSDRFLASDRGKNAAQGAEVGIAACRVVNILGGGVEVYCPSEGSRYRSYPMFNAPLEIRPRVFSEVGISIAQLFAFQHSGIIAWRGPFSLRLPDESVGRLGAKFFCEFLGARNCRSG